MVSRRRLRANQSKTSSNSRGSRRAISIVKRISASGSIAQGSEPVIFAESPSCAHWRQANSRNPRRALSLRSESSIFDAQGTQGLFKHRPVARRWVMGHGPMRGFHEFLPAWMKRPEIRLVPPSSLIDHRVELEVDLVQAPGKVLRD